MHERQHIAQYDARLRGLIQPGEHYYIVESRKTFAQAAADLKAAAPAHGSGVLLAHDLGTTSRSVAIPFAEAYTAFEVCNPAQATTGMAPVMRLDMALP